jgi:hypothetical protein
LTSRFQPSPTLIKQRIEKLIERESGSSMGCKFHDFGTKKATGEKDEDEDGDGDEDDDTEREGETDRERER